MKITLSELKQIIRQEVRNARLLREMEGGLPMERALLELDDNESNSLATLLNNMLGTDLWSDLHDAISNVYPDVTQRVGRFQQLSRNLSDPEWFDDRHNFLQNTINKAFSYKRDLGLNLMRALNAAAYKKIGSSPFRQPYSR